MVFPVYLSLVSGTHLVHVDLALGGVQQVAEDQTDGVWGTAGPGFDVDVHEVVPAVAVEVATVVLLLHPGRHTQL